MNNALVKEKSYLYFLIPGLAFIVLFVAFPLVYNFYLSFHRATLMDLANNELSGVGLSNYIEIIKLPEFVQVLKNTLVFTLGSILFQYIFGLLVSMYFRKNFPLSNLLRGLLMLGWLIPPILVGTTWKWMMNTQVGVINYFLESLGLISTPIPWLVSEQTALLGVIIANIWFGLPFNVIILTSALDQIPASYYESASIDGATWLRKTFSITLPLIKKNSLALLMLGFIFGFRLFDLIWIMTSGGPVFASTVLSIYSYQYSFDLFEFGMGSAVTSIAFLLVLILAFFYVRSTIKEEKL